MKDDAALMDPSSQSPVDAENTKVVTGRSSQNRIGQYTASTSSFKNTVGPLS